MSPAFFQRAAVAYGFLVFSPALRSDLGACELRNLRDEPVAELEVVRSQRSARVGELIRQEDLSEFADRRLEPALIQRGAHADDLLEKGTHGTAAPVGPVSSSISDFAAVRSLHVDPMPAAKTIALFKSPGRGPTT